MATISVDVALMQSSTKRLESCRVVDLILTGIEDADTLAVEPGLLTHCWLETGAAETGEVGVSFSPTTGLITFDTAGSDQAGTLRLFYGRT